MLLKWFTLYLDHRQQLTFNDITSECVPVKSGIGQGTIIGPVIFFLYIQMCISICKLMTAYYIPQVIHGIKSISGCSMVYLVLTNGAIAWF